MDARDEEKDEMEKNPVAEQLQTVGYSIGLPRPELRTQKETNSGSPEGIRLPMVELSSSWNRSARRSELEWKRLRSRHVSGPETVPRRWIAARAFHSGSWRRMTGFFSSSTCYDPETSCLEREDSGFGFFVPTCWKIVLEGHFWVTVSIASLTVSGSYSW